MTTGLKALIIAGAVAATGITVAATTSLAADGDRHGRFGQSRDFGGQQAQRGQNRTLSMLESFDGNGDGQLTQAEIDAARADRVAEFDANGDGQLTLEEYEALWLDAMRERMVDRFQQLDDDGDAIVTTEEFVDPYSSAVSRMDQNDDGVLSIDDMRRRRGNNDG